MPQIKIGKNQYIPKENLKGIRIYLSKNQSPEGNGTEHQIAFDMGKDAQGNDCMKFSDIFPNIEEAETFVMSM